MPIAGAPRTREHGRWWETISSLHARVRSAPTWGHRHQDGPAPTGQPIHGVNLRQRSIWRRSVTTSSRPAVRAAGSAASRRAARRRRGERQGSARVVHATASGCGADGTTEFQYGEEHDLRSLKKMLLGAVTAMVHRSRRSSEPGIGNGADRRGQRARAGERPVPRVARRARPPRLLRLPNGSRLDLPTGAPTSAGTSRTGAAIRPTARSRCPYELQGSRHFYNGCVYTRVHVAEGGHRLHQARRQLLEVPSDRQPSYVDQAVHGRVDGAQHPDGHRWRRRQRGRLLHCGWPKRTTSSVASRTCSASRHRVCCDPANDPRTSITATVKGNIPLNANFSEWGLGNQLTMPGRLGEVGRTSPRARRQRPIDLTTACRGQYDHQLGHPRRPGSRPKDHVNTGRLQCDPRRDQRAGTTDAVDNCPYRPSPASCPRRRRDRPVLDGLRHRSTHAAPIGPFDPLYTLRHAALRRQRRRG